MAVGGYPRAGTPIAVPADAAAAGYCCPYGFAAYPPGAAAAGPPGAGAGYPIAPIAWGCCGSATPRRLSSASPSPPPPPGGWGTAAAEEAPVGAAAPPPSPSPEAEPPVPLALPEAPAVSVWARARSPCSERACQDERDEEEEPGDGDEAVLPLDENLSLAVPVHWEESSVCANMADPQSSRSMLEQARLYSSHAALQGGRRVPPLQSWKLIQQESRLAALLHPPPVLKRLRPPERLATLVWTTSSSSARRAGSSGGAHTMRPATSAPQMSR
eukprot:CAMPEP_0182886492 /NCGR_PEP_ID=MMETSP0034_2-20130328/20253_1 /TAXON_ID=156128 /ORGANISM="Nephroselmis pyriformis, Strain CCMP717" /LENGTH=271 /DNA_ID=CAMNT_0025019821 /DNA_START=22 /DNA_END=840 /DNA_ORIENTATION=+